MTFADPAASGQAGARWDGAEVQAQAAVLHRHVAAALGDAPEAD
jgi:hypothetical protein